MVAKGHDFPDVSLGVVLDADQTLRFPDFRAEERTFALVTQLAGRTGRGASGGRVLVQTLAPEARSIDFATRHDSDGFVADELARRRALRYPPYATLIRVVCWRSPGAARERDGGGDRRRARDAERRRARSRAAVSPPRPGAEPGRDQDGRPLRRDRRRRRTRSIASPRARPARVPASASMSIRSRHDARPRYALRPSKGLNELSGLSH